MAKGFFGFSILRVQLKYVIDLRNDKKNKVCIWGYFSNFTRSFLAITMVIFWYFGRWLFNFFSRKRLAHGHYTPTSEWLLHHLSSENKATGSQTWPSVVSLKAPSCPFPHGIAQSIVWCLDCLWLLFFSPSFLTSTKQSAPLYSLFLPYKFQFSFFLLFI